MADKDIAPTIAALGNGLIVNASSQLYRLKVGLDFFDS